MRRNVKEMGAWFHKEWGGGNIQTFGTIGEKPNAKGNTHRVVNYPFFLSLPWDGKGMEVKFDFGKLAIFGKHFFDFLGKQILGNEFPSHYSPMCFLSHAAREC